MINTNEFMEHPHKKILKKRRNYVGSNNIYNKIPVDNSRYIKISIVLFFYVLVFSFLYNFFKN